MTELYFLTYTGFKNSTPIQDYESLIWTERYSAFGDFSVTLEATPQYIQLAKDSLWMMSNESNRVMMLEKLTVYSKGSKKGLMTISGRSIEAFLEHRWNPSSEEMAFIPTIEDWTRAKMIRFLVEVSTQNVPAPHSGSSLPELAVIYNDTLTAGEEPAGNAVKRQPLYNSVKELADISKIGFKIVRPYTSGYLAANIVTQPVTFVMYRGVDRSKEQSLNSVVRFSAMDGNFVDTTYLQSKDKYKNVIFVRYKGNYASTSMDTTNDGSPVAVSSLQGWRRRTTEITADDIVQADLGLTRARIEAQERGKQALSTQLVTAYVDGTIIGNDFVYKTDYDLGDIVTLEDQYGNYSQARVTEYIVSSDATGKKGYPTLQPLQEPV